MIVYGRNILVEALKSSNNITDIFLEESLSSKNTQKILDIISLAKKRNLPYKFVSRKKIKSLTHSDEHQGVCAKVQLFWGSKLDEIVTNFNKNYIYIYELTFEHNLGAIIRSAECAGFGGVIVPNDVSITPTVAKSSAGSIFHIPVCKESIFQAIRYFKKNGFKIIGIERAGKKYYNEELSFPSLFIIGGEDKSISENVRNNCDTIVEIPQYGKVNSLNMSVAASVIMFESLRQKQNAMSNNLR